MRTVKYRFLIPDDVEPFIFTACLIGRSPLGVVLPLPVKGVVELVDDGTDELADEPRTQLGVAWDGRLIPPNPEETRQDESPTNKGAQANRPSERGVDAY